MEGKIAETTGYDELIECRGMFYGLISSSRE
jgi:hypothetical protein